LAAEPRLFSRLVNVNVGELAVSKFGVGQALRLAWRMLTPGWELYARNESGQIDEN